MASIVTLARRDSRYRERQSGRGSAQGLAKQGPLAVIP
jgi:hypothetical protein